MKLDWVQVGLVQVPSETPDEPPAEDVRIVGHYTIADEDGQPVGRDIEFHDLRVTDAAATLLAIAGESTDDARAELRAKLTAAARTTTRAPK